MPRKSLFPALFLLAAAVLGLNSPILQYPLQVWQEPRMVLAHLAFVLALFVLLGRRLGLAPAFLGALFFAIYPGHARLWLGGVYHWWDAGIYAALFVFSCALALGFDRFYRFVLTQEKVVRYLLIAAAGALIAWMAVETFNTNAPWADEVTLFRWRAGHLRRPEALNGLAQLLQRQPEYVQAQQYERRRLKALQEQKEEALAQPDPKMTALVDEISGLYARSLSIRAGQTEAYYGLAEFDRGLGRTKDAIDLYKKLLDIAPKRRETYFDLARIYQDLGQPKPAIELYNGLLKVYPDDEAAAAQVIDAYSRAVAAHPEETIYQEKREEALAAYEQLSKRKKYTANDYFNLGFLYDQVGGFEEAARYYRKALELQPNHQKALYNLAYRYQAAGDVKTALALYERLSHFYPKFAGAYLNMGIIYNALGDAARAKYLYQRVTGIEPSNAQAYFYLGYLSESAGELREALNDYEKAVENNPKYSEAYYNMGNVYATLQQYPEAIAAYLKTVAVDPNHQNAFVNLSILEFKSGDFQGAIHYLEEARLLGYNPPEAYLKTLEPYRKH